MAPAKCAEGLKLRRCENVEETLSARLGDIEERAPEADGAQARQNVEIRRPIGEQHADEADLWRQRAERRLEPVERAGFGRDPNLIHAGRGKRASLRGEGAGLVGRGAERGADPPSPADRREALPNGLKRDRSERPLGGIGEVDNVRAALQDKRSFRRIDDAGQHQGHWGKIRIRVRNAPRGWISQSAMARDDRSCGAPGTRAPGTTIGGPSAGAKAPDHRARRQPRGAAPNNPIRHDKLSWPKFCWADSNQSID